MLVAKLTYDHIDKRKGELEFTIDGFCRFWEGQMMGENSPLDPEELEKFPQTSFKLYDDDGELYFSGWLRNDDECLVQQFVLAWAMADSGCTTIKVFDEGTGEWRQEIA